MQVHLQLARKVIIIQSMLRKFCLESPPSSVPARSRHAKDRPYGLDGTTRQNRKTEQYLQFLAMNRSGNTKGLIQHLKPEFFARIDRLNWKLTSHRRSINIDYSKKSQFEERRSSEKPHLNSTNQRKCQNFTAYSSDFRGCNSSKVTTRSKNNQDHKFVHGWQKAKKHSNFLSEGRPYTTSYKTKVKAEPEFQKPFFDIDYSQFNNLNFNLQKELTEQPVQTKLK